jgi:heme exporter protein B
MLRAALVVARKDLRLVFSGGVGLAQPVLLGLLLIFLFSLSRPAGEIVPASAAAGIFWLATLFSQVLIFNGLYALEETAGARYALLLSPAPPQAVWLGKCLAGAVLLAASQLVFAPAIVVFLAQELGKGLHLALAGLALVDAGVVVLGSLLGALAQGQAARESLISIIVFPLLIPVLLAGIRIGAAFFSSDGMEGLGDWFGMAMAFDAVFAGAALILFPFVYSGED